MSRPITRRAGPRYPRTEDDSASSHSGGKSQRLSLKGVAANVAHKDAWHRRHQGTRSVEGATVVGQDFVGDPIALGPGGDIGVVCPSVKSHPTPEYAWEGVELALSSTNAVEHQSLPYDPASRRLFGVPIVATVSAAQAWLMCWPPTRWWSTPTARVSGCIGRRRPTAMTSREPHPSSVRGSVRHLGAKPVGRRLLRADGLMTPVGRLSSSRFSANPTGPNPRSGFGGESARDRGTGRRKTTAPLP